VRADYLLIYLPLLCRIYYRGKQRHVGAFQAVVEPTTLQRSSTALNERSFKRYAHVTCHQLKQTSGRPGLADQSRAEQANGISIGCGTHTTIFAYFSSQLTDRRTAHC
jgi:hypothetical protein